MAPAYKDIAETLAEEIRSGVWQPGEPLPPGADLEDRFKVSRVTVRGAYAELAKQGLIYTTFHEGKQRLVVRGRDIVIYLATKAIRPGRVRTAMDAFSENAERIGKTPGKRFVMGMSQPPPEIAARLGVAADSLVVARTVYHTLDGEPWSREIGYYPRDLAEELGLDVPHDIEKGTTRVLRDAGYVEVAWRDETTVRRASTADAEDLHVAVGTPLLITVRTAATADRITRVMKHARIGERTHLVHELGPNIGIGKADDDEDLAADRAAARQGLSLISSTYDGTDL